MPKSKAADSSPPDQAIAEIIGLVDAFCKEHLNAEYADLCRKLAEKLAHKRPSPLLSGKPQTWVCGIVRTIGWVNFLDDKNQSPHMKMTAIDKAFGVGESTGQDKAMLTDGLDDPGERLSRGRSVLEARDTGGGTAEGTDSVYTRKAAASEG